MVSISGESVDDCGGGYSESIAEICDELNDMSNINNSNNYPQQVKKYFVTLLLFCVHTSAKSNEIQKKWSSKKTWST